MTSKEFQLRFLPMQPRLYRLALAMLGVEADAEDAVQETYLKVWRQADRMAEMENADGFLVLTLRNVCLNMIRSRRGTASLDSIDYRVEENDAEMQSLIENEDLMLLRKAISRLQPKARSMVTMFYFSRMSSLQIAEVMGDTDTNVRSILSRARVQLRDMLVDYQKSNKIRYDRGKETNT